MARARSLAPEPRTVNARVGLLVGREQVQHLGHNAIKSQMALDNSTNILAMGSSEKHGQPGNPLTPDQKIRAQKALWGDVFKIVALQDIGATDRPTDWADYVFDRIKSNLLPEPTDYYAGSIHEARWYAAHFAEPTGEPTGRRGTFVYWENRS